MKITITNDAIANKTRFVPGSRGFFMHDGNPLVIIGEDDSYVWTISTRNGMYLGVLKELSSLVAIHITELPLDRTSAECIQTVALNKVE